MDISNNSSSVALSCWKKFYWRYDQKLTPIRQSAALTLGSAVHEAFDQFYKGKSKQDTLLYIKRAFDSEIEQLAPEEQENMTIMKYTALGMFGHFPYFNTVFEEQESEKEFRIKLCYGVYFTGRVDGLVKKDGVWWLRELKTTGQTLRQFHQRISLSSQAMAYIWAMRKLGYDVKGVMFDYIKKPLLRKKVCEDQYEFGTRILGDYKTRPDQYFGQIFSYHNDRTINEWEEDAISIAKDIQGKKRSKRYYRNTNNCYSYNSECPYKKICFDGKPDNLMLQLYYRRDGKEIHQEGGDNNDRNKKEGIKQGV